MSRSRILRTSRTTLLLLTTALVGAIVPLTIAQTDPGDGSVQPAPERTGRDGDAVNATRVRVRYLNHAVLASDRVGIVAGELPREGGVVDEGDVVVQLDDELHRAGMEVARAKADNNAPVDAAEREFDVSRAELEAARQVNLLRENAIPGIEVERLRLARDRNELRIEQARNTKKLDELEHGRLEVELDTFTIEAPFAGRIVKVHRSVGEAVRQGDPIVEIVDVTRMRVEGAVTVAEALRLRRGDQVLVRPTIKGLVLAADQAESNGELVFVDSAVQPVTGLVRVWADVENPHGLLLDGLEAKLTILPGTASSTDAPAKPNGDDTVDPKADD